MPVNLNISIPFIVKLLHLPKIGRKTGRKVIQALSQAITSDADLKEHVLAVRSRYRLPAFTTAQFEDAFQKGESVLELSAKLGIGMLSFLEDHYPRNLFHTDDPPLLLHYKGRLEPLSLTPNVAIIGTSNPTPEGIRLGKYMAEKLSRAGLNIVSGLARGCDTLGHQAALDAQGSTTAVLAHGLDHVYPSENKKLAAQILEKGGLLLSEYSVRVRPIVTYFLERDRIQAGLSDGLFVIETGIKGGTMHTVRFGKAYGRLLACLEYDQAFHQQPKVEGNQLLIRQEMAMPIQEEAALEKFIECLRTRYHLPEEKKWADTQKALEVNSSQKPDTDSRQLNLWN
jgi:DNA processing protein